MTAAGVSGACQRRANATSPATSAPRPASTSRSTQGVAGGRGGAVVCGALTRLRRSARSARLPCREARSARRAGRARRHRSARRSRRSPCSPAADGLPCACAGRWNPVDGRDLLEPLDLPELARGVVELALDRKPRLDRDPGDEPRVVPARAGDLLDPVDTHAVARLLAQQSVPGMAVDDAQVVVREVRAEEGLLALERDDLAHAADGRVP